MATAMTYTSLITDIQAYIERGGDDDPTVQEQLPRIVNRVERSLANELKIQGYQNTLSFTMATGTFTYAKPDSWRSTISLAIGTGTNFNTRKILLPRSYEYASQVWPDRTAMDEPIFYADYDFGHWLISPTPVYAHPAEVLCWCLPDLLSASNESNWLTDLQPQLLLTRCLHEIGMMLGRPDADKWKTDYMEEKQRVTGGDLQKIADRTGSRTTA